LLEQINVTSAVSSVEINLDHSGYTAFKLIITELSKSGSGSTNIIIRVKRDGQSSFDSGSNTYGNQGIIYDTAATRNDNNNVNSIALLTAANSNQTGWSIEALITGALETDKQFAIHGIVGLSQGGGTSTFGFGGTRYNNNEKVTDIQISDTSLDINKCVGGLYGVRT